MRIVTYTDGLTTRAGVIAGDGSIVAVASLVPGAPDDVLGLIAAGPELSRRVGAAASTAKGGVPLKGAHLHAPIPRPRRNVFCVGWNYASHFEEGRKARIGGAASTPSAQEIPEWPAFFSKNPATVNGPHDPIIFPSPHSVELDWEVELAVIIGRSGKEIGEAAAYEHVFGYAVANDVSVRDVQRRHGGQWFKGKNFDTHLPLGPWIVTADELGDPNDLRVSTRVNGETKQDSRTSFMVFKIPRLLRELSTGCALEAGDVIITGTPEGVGFARKPPEFLKVGDVVEVEIERIGTLRNTVVAP